MSLAKNKKVFVYSFDSVIKQNFLYKSFSSSMKVIKFLDYSIRSLSNYLDKNKLYKNQWILSLSKL